MAQASLTIPMKCDAETLWTVLGDMVTNPGRYERAVSLKRKPGPGSTPLKRTIERGGKVIEEEIEFVEEALMVQLTSHNPDLTLIHQIVPSGDMTVLNLAATWQPLDQNDSKADTIENRLSELGETLRKMAEQLAK